MDIYKVPIDSSSSIIRWAVSATKWSSSESDIEPCTRIGSLAVDGGGGSRNGLMMLPWIVVILNRSYLWWALIVILGLCDDRSPRICHLALLSKAFRRISINHPFIMHRCCFPGPVMWVTHRGAEIPSTTYYSIIMEILWQAGRAGVVKCLRRMQCSSYIPRYDDRKLIPTSRGGIKSRLIFDWFIVLQFNRFP